MIRFETELYRAEIVPARLLAATLIMSNKLIDKNRLEQLWEEIKMSDIIEIAREKGMEKVIQEMLLEALIEKFDIVPSRITERIRKSDNRDMLKALFRQVFKCDDLDRFEEVLNRV